MIGVEGSVNTNEIKSLGLWLVDESSAPNSRLAIGLVVRNDHEHENENEKVTTTVSATWMR